MSDGKPKSTAMLESLFAEFDQEVEEFAGVACLSCPLGCGDCCDHADTEITLVEADSIAMHIMHKEPQLITHLEEGLENENRVACVFYDPDQDFHCRIYAVRPLICRSFGYSAYSDRSGNKLFAICPSMPIADKTGGVMQVLFEPYPPVVESYAQRIRSIMSGDERYAHMLDRKRPLAEAVHLALGRLTDEG